VGHEDPGLVGALADALEVEPVLAPRFGVRVLLGTALTLQVLGLAWLVIAAAATTPYTDLVPGFILAGIGMGLTFAPSATVVLADMAPEDHATASSTNSTIREIGVALVRKWVVSGAGEASRRSVAEPGWVIAVRLST
jgi:MFS family permease